MRALFHRIAGAFAIPAGNSDLLQAQCAALSRGIPLMYFIIVANAWALSVIFFDRAPAWLSIDVALLLSVVCTVRLIVWWRRKHLVLTDAQAVGELRRTNVFAAVLSVSFCGWAFALFPYGGAYEQGHVAFFLAVTMLGAMLCLIHLRSAAFIIAGVAGTASILFFAASDVPALVAMAVNLLLVTFAVSIVVLLQSCNFARMVKAQTEARQREQEQGRLLHMIDDMPVAVMTVEPENLRVNYANETSKALIRRIEHLLPIEAENLIGTSIDVFHKDPRHQRGILADPRNLPHNARIKLGPEVLDLKVSAVMDADGSYIGPMLTWALVTKEVEAEKRIRQLAHYDPLTDLPNRVTFHNALTSGLAEQGQRIGLLLVDLDGFKLVNDTRGHRIGDILLGEVAARLSVLCDSHAVEIGRLGGDEFAILVPDNDAQSIVGFARWVIECLSAPYDLDDDRNLQLGASVGIALAPEHGEDADILLARADMALYAAKSAGKGQALVFSPEMEVRVQERVRLEMELRAALDTKEGLFVFYQPIVDIETGHVTAREALVRWHHSIRGWISPGEFVLVAEQSGLIEQLGAFVLIAACGEATRWQDRARVAVNVSAGQLGQGTLAPTVLAALLGSGLSPDRLEVEVTETALHAAHGAAIDDLRRLRDMGVRIALDDFGTGYSSLSHLRVFPFDKIKIDSSFVKEAVTRKESAAIVKAVADLGLRLGVTTVAEGVETKAQLDCVRAEGCREVQGYLFGRPTPCNADMPIITALNRMDESRAALKNSQ